VDNLYITLSARTARPELFIVARASDEDVAEKLRRAGADRVVQPYSAAGKEMGMSYRRAWLLVDEINHIFRAPLVETQMGGSGGGGARLTQLGRDVVGRYRAIEGAAATASAADMRALKAALPERPSGHKPGGEE